MPKPPRPYVSEYATAIHDTGNDQSTCSTCIFIQPNGCMAASVNTYCCSAHTNTHLIHRISGESVKPEDIVQHYKEIANAKNQRP